MSKRSGRGRGGPKGGRGKGGRGGGDGDNRRKRHYYDDDDEWDEAPASWERMSSSERADLREFLDERARKRSHDEETAMFRRWKKYQDHADEYGDDTGVALSTFSGRGKPRAPKLSRSVGQGTRCYI